MQLPQPKYGPFAALVLVLAAWALLRLLVPIIGGEVPYPLFVVAAVLGAWVFGSQTGVVVALAGLGIGLYFYALPAALPSGDYAGSAVRMALYLLLCGSAIRVIEALRRSEARIAALGRDLELRADDLAAERDRFQRTLRSIRDAVIATDRVGLIDFMNAEAERLTGWTMGHARERPFVEVVRLTCPLTGAAVELDDGRLAAPASRRGGRDLVLTTRSGERIPVEDSTGVVEAADRSVTGTVLVLRDVTASRHYEAALEDAGQRKDEFLATLAHELRNPLAPIQNALQVLEFAGDDRQRSSWAQQVIGRQLAQLVRLVDDLLDVARITRGALTLQLQTIPIGSVIAQAIESCRPLLDAGGHRLELALSDAQATIHADPTRATQIFINVLNNAAKYTPHGGRIVITSRITGGELGVAVADSGVGIPAEAAARLFEMFARADADGRHVGGLGVGLGLARKLAELHGGRIEATSPGRGLGSTFTVWFPLTSRQEPAEAVPPAAPEVVVEPGGHRVMVVDDNVDAADSLVALLRILGHDAQAVYDPLGVEPLLLQFDPALVILDVGMPGLDGYELARRIRALAPPGLKRLVALTGWGKDKDVARARDAGFDQHVTKPMTPETLGALLEIL